MVLYIQMEKELFNLIEGFDWDKHNTEKIIAKHKVTIIECEETFLNEHITDKDKKHSLLEDRYYLFGLTNNSRLLTVIFTIRNNKIRVISARGMSRKERYYYNEKTKRITKV